MDAVKSAMAGTWDLLASSDSRYAVWAEEDWDDGITHCLTRLELDKLSGPQTVLDLGCGIGRLTFPVVASHPDWCVWGVDVSGEMIRQARKLRTSSMNPHPHFLIGNGRSLPDSLPAFDLVFSVLMFQHVADDVMCGYLSEVRRVLRSGGWFRFQFVESESEEDQGPLSYGRSRGQVASWLRLADFDLVGTSGDSRFPTWCWVEARRNF